MPLASGRRTFLQTAALLTAAAAAERLLRSASAHASTSLRRSSGDLVELHPTLSEAAFPERNGPRPYRYRGPNLSGASGVPQTSCNGTLYLGGIGNNANAAVPGRVHRCRSPTPSPPRRSRWRRRWASGASRTTDGGRPTASRCSSPTASRMWWSRAAPATATWRRGRCCACRRCPARAARPRTRCGGRLQPVPSVRWGVNSRPNGADLRDGGLLRSTGTHWLRYQGTPGLHGDPLVQDLAAPAAGRVGWWRRRGEACGNEAIGWLPPSGSPSFLAVSEAGLIRWWPG
jgi:hypothetical protein